MIDSHCHLDHEPLISDLDNILLRSKNIGIKKLLTIPTSLERRVSNKYQEQFWKYWYHLMKLKIILLIPIISKNIKNIKKEWCWETGLDFYYNNSDKEKKLKALKFISKLLKTKKFYNSFAMLRSITF